MESASILSLCLDPVEKKTIWASTTNSHINKWVGVSWCHTKAHNSRTRMQLKSHTVNSQLDVMASNCDYKHEYLGPATPPLPPQT